MGNRLVIAGAGGFGREVFAWASASPRFLREHDLDEIVFLNDIEPSVAVPAAIVSSIGDYRPQRGDLALCAVGSSSGRRSIVERLETVGASFATLVDDRAVLGERVQLGEGTIICPGSVLTTDIVVGRHSHINLNCAIGHDARIGEFTTVSPTSSVMGDARLGSDVFLGTTVTVAPRVSIGDGSVIGAGSVVVKDIEAAVTAFGNPCRVVRRNDA